MKTDGSSSFSRRFFMRAVATFGLAAAVLVSWWMRVEDARHKDNLPNAVIGQPIDLGPNLLTPLSIDLEQKDDGKNRLVLRARVENRTGQTVNSVFGFPPKLPHLQMDTIQLGEPEIILDRDGERLSSLQPRMPEDVSIVWHVPSEWQPTEVELTFYKQKFKLRDNLYGQSSWLGFEASANLTLAVDAKR